MAGNRATPAQSPAAGARAAVAPPEAHANAPIAASAATRRRPARPRRKYRVFGRNTVHPVTVVPWNGAPTIAFRRAARSRPWTTRSGMPARAITRAATGSKTIVGPAARWPSPISATSSLYVNRSNRRAFGSFRGSAEYTPSTEVAFTRRAAPTVRAREARVRAVPQGDREGGGVHAGALDPELVEPALAGPEGTAHRDVEPRDPPAARDREDLPAEREVAQELREVREVPVVRLVRVQDGPAQRDDDLLHGPTACESPPPGYRFPRAPARSGREPAGPCWPNMLATARPRGAC